MSIYLRWLPEGQDAANKDFRLLRVPGDDHPAPLFFQTYEQLFDYLRDHEWPEGERPWAQEPGGAILTPDDLSNGL